MGRGPIGHHLEERVQEGDEGARLHGCAARRPRCGIRPARHRAQWLAQIQGDDQAAEGFGEARSAATAAAVATHTAAKLRQRNQEAARLRGPRNHRKEAKHNDPERDARAATGYVRGDRSDYERLRGGEGGRVRHARARGRGRRARASRRGGGGGRGGARQDRRGRAEGAGGGAGGNRGGGGRGGGGTRARARARDQDPGDV